MELHRCKTHLHLSASFSCTDLISQRRLLLHRWTVNAFRRTPGIRQRTCQHVPIRRLLLIRRLLAFVRRNIAAVLQRLWRLLTLHRSARHHSRTCYAGLQCLFRLLHAIHGTAVSCVLSVRSAYECSLLCHIFWTIRGLHISSPRPSGLWRKVMPRQAGRCIWEAQVSSLPVWLGGTC